MAVIEIARIQVRRGQELITGVPQLEPGEFGWAQDTENLYIGKRISEGATDNSNTRILTERDLSTFFALAANTGTTTTVYRYRDGTPHLVAVTTTTVQAKLDDQNPSLLDFGVVSSFTATDITAQFQNAVTTIFNNPYGVQAKTDARRVLKIPAGHFFISSAISLPPFAKISGAGPELTRLTLISSSTNIFRTVDADGNTFSSGSMQSGVKRARSVFIDGLTLECDPLLGASQNPLVSFDNVFDAQLKDCVLRTAINSTSTTTYGLVSAGVGVGIRGTGGGLGSGDVNLCENIRIENCRFDSLYNGIVSTGTVIRPVVTKNIFSNINRSVEMYTINALPGPSNALIDDNRFENVVREAVYIGSNLGNIYSNNVVSNNFFVQVGNGTGLSDFVTTSQYAVLNLQSNGTRVTNNIFSRKIFADATTATNFYYNPLVVGNATVDDSASYVLPLVANTLTNVTRIPLTGSDQLVSVRYQIYGFSTATNYMLSRKGNLIVNILPDGTMGITDNYNFVEDLPTGITESPDVYFDSSINFTATNNYTVLTFNTSSTNLTLEYQLNSML
jgi:hypothetical protein